MAKQKTRARGIPRRKGNAARAACRHRNAERQLERKLRHVLKWNGKRAAEEWSAKRDAASLLKKILAPPSGS